MKLDDLLGNTSEWLKCSGPESEIVLSSRIRLARNFDKAPFSTWADKKESLYILEKSQAAIANSPTLKDMLFLKLEELTPIDRQFLLERHLISREHTMDADNKAAAISENETISIMVNEEDHLRLQVIKSGLNLLEGWQLINKIDDELGQNIEYAFSKTLGYLTACPTNVGTGLRASVMLHLPALFMSKQIDKILQAITKLTMTARGFYGEGTQTLGNFFQISNQVTLGHSEQDIVENIDKVIRQIVGHEQSARTLMLSQNKNEINDQIWRAFGTLKNAYIITSKETIDLLSFVRLGIDTGLIKNLSRQAINELLILLQPAHLQKIEGKILSPKERDVKRAQIIREKLSSV